MTPEQIARVRALIEARRLTERTRTTWDGDTRGREMVATTDALEALLAAVDPPGPTLVQRPECSVSTADIGRIRAQARRPEGER